jgi:hypothetical protein
MAVGDKCYRDCNDFPYLNNPIDVRAIGSYLKSGLLRATIKSRNDINIRG